MHAARLLLSQDACALAAAPKSLADQLLHFISQLRSECGRRQQDRERTLYDTLRSFGLVSEIVTTSCWLYAVSCGTQRSHFVMAGANGWAGRWLSLDMRK